MDTKSLLIVLCMGLAGESYGQYQVKYETIDGLHWISSSSESYGFGLTPVDWDGGSQCEETLTYLTTNSTVKRCKEHQGGCNEALLARLARKRAFGADFDRTEQASADSRVDWDISSHATERLDPELLDSYARQLGIDPAQSVVATVGTENLAHKVNYFRPIVFRPLEEGQLGGSSWFFQNEIGMLTEDLALETYFDIPTKSTNAVQLVSKFLNCELFAYPQEYVFVPFNYTMNGLRPVSQEQGTKVYQAYQKLADFEAPAGSSELEKAVLYGYVLATHGSGVQLEMANVVNHLFDVSNGIVLLRRYGSAIELTEKLKIKTSYERKGGYLKLFAKRLE